MGDTYVRVRRLDSSGLDFTPGTDWAAQFDSEAAVVTAVPTVAGEILVPEGSQTDLILLATNSGVVDQLLTESRKQTRLLTLIYNDLSSSNLHPADLEE